MSNIDVYKPELTLAQDNDRALRSYLRLRRRRLTYWTDVHQRMVQRMIDRRKMYRSDEPMKVWVIEDAYGEYTMHCLEDDFNAYMEEHDSEDTPVSWHNEMMTGREYGNLKILDI